MAKKDLEPTKQDQKRDLDKYAHARQQISSVIEEFKKESDRACVIIAAARADNLLFQILSRLFLPNTASQDDLLDSDRALGTFSARIHVTYRLGLIDPELTRALHLLRKMRNGFAHETSSASMDQASHRDRVREIIAPLVRFKEFESFKTSVMSSKTGVAADFCTGVSVIIARLESVLEEVRQVCHTSPCHLVPPRWRMADRDEKAVTERGHR